MNRLRLPNSAVTAIAAGVLVTLAFTLYARNLNDYFLGDDFELIRSFHDKPVGYFAGLLVYNESGDAWKHLGYDPAEGGYLRPLKIWLLALDHVIWGVESTGYHATATIVFALNLVMILLLARRLLPDSGIGFPFLAAFAAGIHPVFGYTVPSITFREETLASAFVLAAVHAFVGFRRNGRGIGLVCLWCALALLTKESGITAVLLIGGYDLTHALASRSPLRELRRRLPAHLPVVSVAIVYFGLRVVAFGNPIGGWGRTRHFSWDAFVEHHVSLIRSLSHPSLFAGHAIPGVEFAAVTLIVLALLMALHAKDRLGREFFVHLVYLGPVWYLACSLVNHGIYFAPRHHVVVVAGLAIAGTFLIEGVSRSWSGRIRNGVVLLAMAVTALAFLPATSRLSRDFDAASRGVERVRRKVERETRGLEQPCRVLVENAPIFSTPPYYFGWGLQAALSKPFSETDLARRCEVVSPEDLRINRRSVDPSRSFDAVVRIRHKWPDPEAVAWSRPRE